MSGIVVTVTPNPAVDATVTLDALRPGAVHRARAVRHDAGGKGVNVASCLADWGVPVAATGFLGADNTAIFERLLAAKGIADRFVRVPGETRINVKLLDPAGTTDINLPGPAVLPAALAELGPAITDGTAPGDLVVLAGSLPVGIAPDTYAALVARLRERGLRVVLDASGPALAAALAADRLPWCIKPNRHELEEWAGAPLPTLTEIVLAANALRGRGIGLVVVSLGEEGAVFVAAEGALRARLPAVGSGRDGALSTVGAGDAMVAGIVAALREEAGLERVARLGTAFAVAKLGRPGPNLPTPAVVEALSARVEIAAA
ncbi:1-phosphofructokinase [Roseomonas sp. NAR14]|uniref:Phosphofructokinase n=1 Tax=Roseomonas acroporae TaxID=2937791 RepID=A0A9X1Y4G0_9PROT|nr:1-phosphofructokinase [Roseomonas acroporae]MCK8783351.1 1-phosphofructokinase [Roseomonas acroporae]